MERSRYEQERQQAAVVVYTDAAFDAATHIEKHRGNLNEEYSCNCACRMLASSMAFAQSDTNSGAGTAGKPGSKSGPAMTKSGAGSANQSGTNPDQSNVKGMPGNKSGPPVKPPSQK